MNYPWIGKAVQIDDYDLPRIGHKIGVGEDIIHMFMDVESRGEGFDKNGVIKLFEEHKFYRHVDPSKRDKAVKLGLAYPKWRKNYKNNHGRFLRAYELDPVAALMSCSWGLGQIMGENHKLVGYKTVLQMVKAFAADEANQLEAMIDFVVNTKIDDELREMEKTPSSNRTKLIALARIVASTYNGKGYAKNNYHNRLVDRLIWWRKKPDTPWSPNMAIEEDKQATERVEQFKDEVAEEKETNAAPPGKNVIEIIFDLLKKLLGGWKK